MHTLYTQAAALTEEVIAAAVMDKPLGLVINFGNVHLPTRGVKRVILKGADVEAVSF